MKKNRIFLMINIYEVQITHLKLMYNMSGTVGVSLFYNLKNLVDQCEWSLQ